jgi:hypothetical protein
LENGEIETWKDVTVDVNSGKRSPTDVIKVPNSRYISMVNKSKEFTTKSCGSLHGRDKSLHHGIMLDTYHYKGKEKPWLQPIETDNLPKTFSEDLQGRGVWLYWLGIANQTLSLSLPSVINSTGRGTSGVLDWKSDRNMLLQPDINLPVPII